MSRKKVKDTTQAVSTSVENNGTEEKVENNASSNQSSNQIVNNTSSESPSVASQGSAASAISTPPVAKPSTYEQLIKPVDDTPKITPEQQARRAAWYKEQGIDPTPLERVDPKENLKDTIRLEPKKGVQLAGANEHMLWKLNADGTYTKPDGNIATNQEVYRKIFTDPSESAENKKKRERREKIGKYASMAGDIISSAANLFFASKGAPNMYDKNIKSLSEATRAQYDKLKKEREDKKDAYDAGLYKAVMADITNAEARKKYEAVLKGQRDKIEAMKELQRMKNEEARRAREEKAKADLDKVDKTNSTRVEVENMRQNGQTRRAQIAADSKGGNNKSGKQPYPLA